MLTCTASQMLTLNNWTTPMCLPLLKILGILLCPRYIHRSSHQKFVHSRTAPAIPSLYTTCSITSLTRHQNALLLPTCCFGNVTARKRTGLDGRSGVDFSLLRPLKRYSMPENIKMELFNVQSNSNKSGFLHDHILD